jgi:hypothetical protein
VDHCFLWTRGSTRSENVEVCVPRRLPRDVHSVVSDTAGGKPWPKPVMARLKDPKVVELTPGVYHGGGLLPVDHLNGSFILRSVFTPTKWCRRRLTRSEVAMALTFPLQLSKHARWLSLICWCVIQVGPWNIVPSPSWPMREC